MKSFLGVGTTLYGRREVWPDGSYIATAWKIFLLLPIIPLASYRVKRGETKATLRSLFIIGARTSYSMLPAVLNTKQITNTYLVGWGTPVLIFIFYVVRPDLFMFIPLAFVVFIVVFTVKSLFSFK